MKLKEWISVEEAARHISSICEESVTEADVLRLALDGHLKLSIRLVNGAYGFPCVPVRLDELDYLVVASPIRDVGPDLPMLFPKGGRVWEDESGEYIQAKRTITRLEAGVWDLLLNGGERYDVEQRYQVLTGGPDVTTVTIDGVFVRSSTGDLFEIQVPNDVGPASGTGLANRLLDSSNFHPAGTLPEDGVFVVRMAALVEFEQMIAGVDNAHTDKVAEKPLGSKERNGLVSALGVACRLAKLDYTRPAKTAGLIADEAARMGVHLPESTVENYLKRIPDTLQSRMK